MVRVAWRGPSALNRYGFSAVGVLLEYLTDTPVAPLQRELVEVSERGRERERKRERGRQEGERRREEGERRREEGRGEGERRRDIDREEWRERGKRERERERERESNHSSSHRLKIHFVLKLTAMRWRILKLVLGLSCLEFPWRRLTLVKTSECLYV